MVYPAIACKLLAACLLLKFSTAKQLNETGVTAANWWIYFLRVGTPAVQSEQLFEKKGICSTAAVTLLVKCRQLQQYV